MMNFFIKLIWLGFFFGIVSDAYSLTVPAEAVKVHLLAVDMKVYEDVLGKPAESWQDLAAFFGDERIDIKLPSGERFTDVYSIIPRSEGVKFPAGVLICIRYKPTDWPDAWSDGSKERDARARPIRYLIYKNNKGEVVYDSWDEEDVHAMLAQAGLIVPAPKSYTASSLRHSGLANVHSLGPVKLVNKGAPIASSDAHRRIVASETNAKKSAHIVWWIIGFLLVFSVVVGLLLKKTRFMAKGTKRASPDKVDRS